MSLKKYGQVWWFGCFKYHMQALSVPGELLPSLLAPRGTRQGFSQPEAHSPGLQLLQALPDNQGLKASLAHHTYNLNREGNFCSRYSGIKIVENIPQV